jgi:DNA-binding Lrp family transcriptional regulator
MDRIDIEIVAALQKNARLSNKELAALVGLAPSTTHGRLRRLVETGVLRGFFAEPDPEALGVGLQAVLFVRLARHSRDLVDGFHRDTLALPEVIALSHVGGRFDFLVQVAVRDAHHLRDLAMDHFTTHPAVATLETALLFGHERAPMPRYR